MNPTFQFDSIDVLVNRNSLRRFFKFCSGRPVDSFRVDLHLVNNTLIIEKCVKRSWDLLGSTCSGFGFNFERAVTRLPPGLVNSSAHHRVLRYNLGGLECAVRFEVDASYEDAKLGEAQNPEEHSYAARGDIESLESELWSMIMTSGTDGSYVPVSAISQGPGTPQTSVAELKTCGPSKKTRRELQQLWFGRTRYLVTGYHDNGIFSRVKVDDLEEGLVAWENDAANQTALRKMAVLLSRLREVASKTEGKSCAAIFQRDDEEPALRVFTSTSRKGPLPDSMIERFWKT